VGVAAVRSRVARRIAVASLVAAGNPVRVLDDLAYGVGVWRGVLRERTIAPLLPRFSSWPGRRADR
jgi:mycofactocin glycosyltransferase